MTSGTVLTSIPVSELTTNIFNLLKPELVELFHSFNNPPAKQEEEYLSRTEVCKLLRISNPTLWRLQKSGKLQPIQIGRRILFDKKAIHDVIKNAQNNRNAPTEKIFGTMSNQLSGKRKYE